MFNSILNIITLRIVYYLKCYKNNFEFSKTQTLWRDIAKPQPDELE